MHLIVTAFRKSYLASMCCIAVLAWPTVANAVEIQGFTEPYQDIDVAAAEAGIVEAIHVSEGDRVHENQLLLQLD
ncbi:MAG: efflux RND transporter periplasmic adaptor subunit, partial [Planctomycetales bacterium]|nr:efflux RND transporter periplasmic adaptor subunit [Planctomycetales bacterium]